MGVLRGRNDWRLNFAVLGVSCAAAAVAAACGTASGGAVFFDGTDGSLAPVPNPDLDAGLGLPDADTDADAAVTVDALEFDPPAALLTVDGVTPGTATFTLKATKKGKTFAVQPQSIQFDRPDLAKGQLGTAVTLTTTGRYAGKGTLHGVFGGKEATAQLTVAVALKEIGPGVPPGAVTALSGSGLPADPKVSSLLYPYDKTIFPLGITTPLVMWAAPNGADVYRLHFEQQNYTYDGYFAVPLPGQLRVSQDTWDHLTASNGGDAMKVTLSRWDAVSGTAFASGSESWTIAPSSLRGAIYYWTTSNGGHMARIRPGTGAQPEVLNGGKCMGCHAVSADGTTLVAGVAGLDTSGSPPGEGQPSWDLSTKYAMVSFDLPNGNVRTTTKAFSGNVAVNPNGKYTVFGDQKLYLAETATGSIVTSGLDTAALDTGMKGFMTPAFSPDGKHLAVVEGAGTWYHNLMGGKLVTFDFDETTHQFSNLTSLVSTSAFPANQRAISYPSFTPDSQSIAFHVGDHVTGCDADQCDDLVQQLGALWMQSVAGTAPVKLDTLNDSSSQAADHNLSLEPTFNPVERGGYHWVVFTSMRDWGNKLTGTANNGKKRLWVAAIDKTTGTTDPSHPAFFLEGQEEGTTNMRGFWSLAACIPSHDKGGGGGSCQAGFECCSGFCDKGSCVDTGSLACKGVGDGCSSTDQCCNAGEVTCDMGRCTVRVPR